MSATDESNLLNANFNQYHANYEPPAFVCVLSRLSKCVVSYQ